MNSTNEKERADKQKGYIKLVYLGIGLGRSRWKDIATEYKEFKDKNFEVTGKTTTNEFVKAMLNIDDKGLEDIVNNKEVKFMLEVRKNQFLGNKEKFETINNEKGETKSQLEDPLTFFEWYLKQKQECYYCGISQKKLKDLFEKGKISSKKPSFSATLQIEKKNPDKGYTTENCVLACCLCNNAKSDMISYCNYKKYFAPQMGEFLEYLSNDGKNEMDKTTD